MSHFSSLKKKGQMLIMDTKECVQWRAFIHGGLDCGSSLLFLISFFLSCYFLGKALQRYLFVFFYHSHC
jgi:hypothetical protein